MKELYEQFIGHKKLISILVLFAAFQFFPIQLAARNYSSWFYLYEITLLYAVTSAAMTIFNHDDLSTMLRDYAVILILFSVINTAIFFAYQTITQFSELYLQYLAAVNQELFVNVQHLPFFHLLGTDIILTICMLIQRNRIRATRTA